MLMEDTEEIFLLRIIFAWRCRCAWRSPTPRHSPQRHTSAHLRCLPLTRCGLVPWFACDPQHVAMQKLMQVFDSSTRFDLRRSPLFRRTP